MAFVVSRCDRVNESTGECEISAATVAFMTFRTTKAFLPSDNIGKPCGCAECEENGVDKEPQRKIPSGFGYLWIHGARLRSWLDAREAARLLYKNKGPKGMR